ncbi:hypothetical protein ACA910_001353 [Epithemia clementina (nom. ined.)]
MSNQICLMNEKAIEYILVKDYKVAAVVLSGGINMLEQENDNDDNSSNDDEGDSSMNCGDEGLAFDFDTFAVDCCSSLPSELKNVENIGDLSSFTLFNKPLTIPSHLRPAERDCDFNLVCCIFLYNYGLSLHLQALATGGEDALLEEALLSYEMALGLVSFAGGSVMVQVVELALLNNCGQIHTLQFATQNVYAVLQRMQIILEFLFITHAISQKTLAPFSFNLICNAAQHTRPAPCA